MLRVEGLNSEGKGAKGMTESSAEDVKGPSAEERSRGEEEDELQAEQESAEAMDADVPHPPESSKAGGGPSA
ncbi:MAG: hypothetical protein DMF65_12785 [Acidobacteria bacterium]|nr:MAG: hypothetical protein DMF65_12785 [Acidobacteriota bacterium]